MPKKQKSGLYRARVKIGVDDTGKDIYKYVSGKTQKELEANKRKVVEYYIEGTGLKDDELFATYAINWYKVYKQPLLAVSTQKNYRTMLNKHILPVFGDRKLRAIRPTELRQFMNRFNGMSFYMPFIARAIFNGIFNAACADNILARNPMMHVPKDTQIAPTREKRPLTRAERKRIEEMCATHPKGLYIAILYYLGVRHGEALGLRWGDIDFAAQTVHIQRDIDRNDGDNVGELKNKYSNRIVPIPNQLMELLVQQRGMPNMYILHLDNNRPLNKYQEGKLWRELIVNECGITDITTHSLRHNYITLCWEAGIDAYATARFAGHNSPETTLRVYTHLSKERELDNMALIQKAFAK